MTSFVAQVSFSTVARSLRAAGGNLPHSWRGSKQARLSAPSCLLRRAGQGCGGKFLRFLRIKDFTSSLCPGLEWRNLNRTRWLRNGAKAAQEDGAPCAARLRSSECSTFRYCAGADSGCMRTMPVIGTREDDGPITQ